MKKILLSILGILIGFVGFGYCEYFVMAGNVPPMSASPNGDYLFTSSPDGFFVNSLFIGCYPDTASLNFSYFLYDYLDNLILSGVSYLSGFIGNSGRFPIYLRGIDLNTFIYSGYKLTIVDNSFNNGFSSFCTYSQRGTNPYTFVDGFNYNFLSSSIRLYFYSIDYNILSAPKFTVNYGNQSKDYTMDQDVDIYINGSVSKNGNIFSYDGSTGINLVYNGQYNRYTKNKLYLDGQFWYRQGVFTPICL